MTPQTAARAYYASSDERLRLQDAEVNPLSFIFIINIHSPIAFRRQNSLLKSMLTTASLNLQQPTQHF